MRVFRWATDMLDHYLLVITMKVRKMASVWVEEGTVSELKEIKERYVQILRKVGHKRIQVKMRLKRNEVDLKVQVLVCVAEVCRNKRAATSSKNDW